MKILLIRPKPARETIGLQSIMICEPLELMVLASVIKENGHDVEIIDMILEKNEISHFINTKKPDVIGITGYISHVNIMKNYAKIAKSINNNIKVCVGGVHATVCPEDFLSENIDKICRSEDDFYDFLNLENREKKLPFRDLEQRYLDKYYYIFQEKCALIKTSFGCPYSCNFCFCKEITKYHAREIDDVINELLHINQTEIYIVDDDFLYNRSRLIEFYEKIKQNKIKKRYLVYGRADFIAQNEDIISKLKEIGLSAVIVGIEASNQDELDKYNKKTELSSNFKAIDILKKYDIECYATIILGTEWGKKEFKDLYKYTQDLGLIFVNLQPLTPLKGTGYFEEYKDKLIIPYEEIEKWDMAHLVIKPTKLSVRAYYFEIVKLYYKITLKPKNILYMMKKYGLKTIFKLSKGAREVNFQYFLKILRG